MNIRSCKFAIFLSFVLLMVSGCCIEGSGEIEQRDFEIAHFSNIYLDVPATVRVHHSDRAEMSIQTDENIMEHIRTRVIGDTLNISLVSTDCCVAPTMLEVSVSTAQLGQITAKDSASVVIEDAFEADVFRAQMRGSGGLTLKAPIISETIDFHVEGKGTIAGEVLAEQVFSHIDGSGVIKIRGEATTHSVEVNGSGRILAFGLLSRNTDIVLRGNASCDVSASEQLDIDIEGAGVVYYRGDPVVTQQVSGVGIVEKVDSF